MRQDSSPDPEYVDRARSMLVAVASEDVRAIAETKIANLEQALKTARTIGMALGIVMERQKLSEFEAFQVLVHFSQRTHRKLNAIAEELVFTGRLPAR